MTEYPPQDKRHLVERVASLPTDAAEWTGNAASGDQHHGLVSINQVPFYLRLLWQSANGAKTAEIGQYKLRLGALASAGYIQKKPGMKVRLRFVRADSGVVSIQVNGDGPLLPVGQAAL
ncbi:hypothetical protein BH09GEM1_BH09GEM1_07450 [soil metagenome]